VQLVLVLVLVLVGQKVSNLVLLVLLDQQVV